MRSNITEDDEGKKVTYAGDTVGRVVDVVGGTAYVEHDASITETVKSKLGWGDHDTDSIALEENSIVEVTDDEVRIDVTE
jgi:hypothetical protein